MHCITVYVRLPISFLHSVDGCCAEHSTGLLLQVPLPWEAHVCMSMCQLLICTSRLQCQLPELMQQVLNALGLTEP